MTPPGEDPILVHEWTAGSGTSHALVEEAASVHEHLDGKCDGDDAGSVRAARHMVSTGAYEGPAVDEPSVLDGLAARRGEGGGPHNLADSGMTRSVHDVLADEVMRPEGAARQVTGSVDGIFGVEIILSW